MLRSTATQSLIKNISRPLSTRSSYSSASLKLRNAVPLRQLNNKRPMLLPVLSRPTTTSLLYATKPPLEPVDKIDRNAEHKYAQEKLEPHPEEVSTKSSVRRAFEGSGDKQNDEQMLGSIKDDIVTIKDTFALTDVPKEPLYFGIAGVLPYAATSMTSLFLAYDINHTNTTGTELLFTPETAHQILETLLPIQIGYGAMIISFLGAIHWGLEYAGYGGQHSYQRYAYGVIAPAIAWPTIFMSVEHALITQFIAFMLQYFTDARATVRGWCPPWYLTYRFVLTFFVGGSIVLSLIGRGQMSKSDVSGVRSTGLADRDHDTKWRKLELEEMKKREEEEATKNATDDEESEVEDKDKDAKKEE